jgi:hypothetical protein
MEMDEVAFYDLMDKKIALCFPVLPVLNKYCQKNVKYKLILMP